jgi:hypothetical protein
VPSIGGGERPKSRRAEEPKRRWRPPQRPAAGGFDDTNGHGMNWAEWKREWLARLVDAETKLTEKLTAIQELKEKVEAL